MKDSYEQRIQNQFGAFCVKVLKNEARRISSVNMPASGTRKNPWAS